MSDTHTLTALYPDHAAAERAAERLRGVGVPEKRIELHRSDEGDVRPGQHPVGDGLFGALSSLLVPEEDLRAYERGLGRGRTVLVASHVPGDRLREAEDALDEGALELDEEAEWTSPEDEEGAIGSAGGFGRATGEVDRLTGETIGTGERTRRTRSYPPR
jgi:hypothetical protein